MKDLNEELARLDFVQCRYQPPTGHPKGQAGALACAHDRKQIASLHSEPSIAPKAQRQYVSPRVALLNVLSRHSVQSLREHGFKVNESRTPDLLPAA